MPFIFLFIPFNSRSIAIIRLALTSCIKFTPQNYYFKSNLHMHNSPQITLDLIKEQKNLYQQIFNKKDNIWKIIVLDQPNLDIVSTLMKLKDFRSNNITLYFDINQNRQQIHGVPIVYVVRPTMDNANLIVSDFDQDLYSSVIVHFTSEPSPHLLSTFAKNLSKKKSALSKVQKVEFSNVGFQCIDRQMCILPENSQLLNLLAVLKQLFDQFRNQIIFVYSPSEQERVNKLKQKLMESNFTQKVEDQQKKSTGSKKYTKVLIFNRQNDMFPVFGHGITYASLMQDVCRFNKSGTKILDKKQQIDLNDEIWLDRKNMLTSEMELQNQLNKIKTKIMGSNNKMQEFSQLPEKQKRIQWHLDNAAQIISQAKQRRLNEFHAVEEDLYIKKMLSGQSKNQFIELLATGPKNEDKIRLMLAYLTCAQNYDQNQVQELEGVFPQIKKHNFYNQLKTRRMKNESQQNANSKYIKRLAKGLWKNLVNEEKKYLLVKYLQKTKDLSERNLSQIGLKMACVGQVLQNPRIQHSLIYCIGGVCFNEYANLTEFNPNVIYTGDKFVNYRDFI